MTEKYERGDYVALRREVVQMILAMAGGGVLLWEGEQIFLGKDLLEGLRERPEDFFYGRVMRVPPGEPPKVVVVHATAHQAIWPASWVMPWALDDAAAEAQWLSAISEQEFKDLRARGASGKELADV